MDEDQVATRSESTASAPPRPAPHDCYRTEFTVLYLEDLRKLVGFVIKLGATVEEAADVAQSTFELAWRGWDSIQINHRAWLRTVAA
jgi:DNA-directed RNA polymerase specialized sigma24 family protein